jgi:HK97 family phage portal protein
MLLNGEAFWVLDDRSPLTGFPRMILPLIPSGVKVNLDRDNLISSYSYRTADKEWKFDAQDVVHFKLPNPEDWFRGHSPVKSAWWALETHEKADELNFYKMQNRAIPAGLLTSEKAIPEKERKKLLNQFLNLFGGTENTDKTGILPWGLDFKKVQESNAEMQFKEGKETNRDEILGNLRVGLEMLGKTESQTRANAEASNYVFQRFNIVPFLEIIADALTNDYLPIFNPVEGQEIGFPDPVPENTEEKRATGQMLLDTGAGTIDEVRSMFGLDPLEIAGWTDVPLIALTKQPIGTNPIIPEDEDQQDEEEEPEDEPEDTNEDEDEADEE